MSLYDNNQPSTIGGFTQEANSGFKQTLVKLKETMESEFNLDYTVNAVNILGHRNLREQYMGILTEDYSQAPAGYNPEEHNRNVQKFEQLAENSRQLMLSEAQGTGTLMPVVGLTLPLLKMYWIKNRYKDVLPTEVATMPTVKKGLERQFLEDSEGNVHWLPDLFENKDAYETLMGATRKMLFDGDITVPSLQYDLMGKSGGSRRQDDQISKNFFIKEITVDKTGLVDDKGVALTADVVMDNLRVKVDEGTGMFRYEVKYLGKIIDILTGDLDYTTGVLNVGCVNNKVKAFKVHGYLSSENNLYTASVGWKHDDYQFVIPDGEHLTTGLTEERIKDENVIYNIDSTAKVIQQMTDTLNQLKDLKVQRFLNDSRDRIQGTSYWRSTTFDCKPPSTYITPTQWTKEELNNTLDRLAIGLGKILKDENISFVILASRMNARLLDNVTWGYGQDTSEVGGCKLDYNIGLYNNMRNFKVVSSERQSEDAFQILVLPKNADHITYIQLEYQFIISNQYREQKNVRVPAVMVSDRYLTDEITPIQGEIKVLNNKVSSSEIYM